MNMMLTYLNIRYQNLNVINGDLREHLNDFKLSKDDEIFDNFKSRY